MTQLHWVLLFGLDNVGKTSLLNYLIRGNMGKTIPTMSFDMRQFRLMQEQVVILDFAGQKIFRDIWLNDETWGYKRKKMQTQNIYRVFVIDATETKSARLKEAAQWYAKIKQAFQKINLIIATKQDLLYSDNVTSQHIKERLQLSTSPPIAFMSAKTGYNVKKGFTQLIGARFLVQRARSISKATFKIHQPIGDHFLVQRARPISKATFRSTDM